MTRPRSEIVNAATTPYYHCVSRCVRRAFLCGRDRLTKKSFDHRKVWLQERIRFLSEIFAIDVCAYAVMSNHHHMVVRLVPERAASWTSEEVERRFGLLFSGAKQSLKEKSPSERVRTNAAWREKLASLSWMMRALNEWIARKANREEEIGGRFWEGRFKSQPILDDAGLLMSMAYVDLNPVRAGVTSDLESSDFTSIQERLVAAGTELAKERKESERATKTSKTKSPCPKGLAPFRGQKSASRKNQDVAPLPWTAAEYVDFVRWAGTELTTKRGKTRGRLVEKTELLAKVGIAADKFIEKLRCQGLSRFGVIGTAASVEDYVMSHQLCFARGIGQARFLAAA